MISAKAGLSISKSKTKGMRINTTNADRQELNGEEIDDVKDFAYHGNNISKDGGSDRDIQLTIGKARTAFIIVIPLWKSKTISRKTKRRKSNTNVKSIVLYGTETWRATKAASNELQSFVKKCLQTIMGIRWPQVIRNDDLWERTEEEQINIQIRRGKWGWIKHKL